VGALAVTKGDLLANASPAVGHESVAPLKPFALLRSKFTAIPQSPPPNGAFRLPYASPPPSRRLFHVDAAFGFGLVEGAMFLERFQRHARF
jgi:hypothetical protein